MKNPYTRLPGQAAPHRGPTSLVVPVPPRPADPREVAVKVNEQIRQSLTAASKRIVSDAKGPSQRPMQAATWQQEVFAFYDQVGELQFVADTSANAAGQVYLELVRRDEHGDMIKLSDLSKDELTVNDKQALRALRELTWDVSMSDLLAALYLQLFLVGQGWLVGTPSRRNKKPERLLNFDWCAYSVEDVVEKNGLVVIDGKEYDPDSIIRIKVWEAHPRIHRDASSPVRSTLPVLRELVGLTMHIGACIDSRLAGAGIVWMPQSASVMGLGGNPEDADDEDPFLDAVIEAGVTAIKDRDSAAAIIPIFVTLPDDVGFQPQHMTFSTPFDASTKELRDEAIRRLALSLDAPPEILLGTGDASHWSAWSIQEDYLRLHVLPRVSMIARCLVKEYLRPVLEEMGLSEEEADDYNLIPSAEHLVSRPNRFSEAMELYSKGVLSQAAVLEASGFELKDAPEEKLNMDYATQVALLAVSINPSLYESPGLLSIKSQVNAALAGYDLSNAPEDALPPMLNHPAGPDPDQNDPTKAPESDNDRKPNEVGPAKNRERDNPK